MQALNKKLVFSSLLILWIGFQLIQLNGEWTRMDDDAHYILHARSLVVNQLYNDPHFVYMSEVNYIPKNTSPGWPLMLVPIIFLFGVNVLILKVVVILFAFVSGIWIFKICKARSQDEWTSLLITGIYYFSMTTIVFTKVIYSEWPYLFISFVILQGFVREGQKPSRGRHFIYWGILLGILLSIRFVAVSLLLAVIATIIQKEMIVGHKFWNGIKHVGIVLLMTFITYQSTVLIANPEKGSGYMEQFLSKDLYYRDTGQATLVDVIDRIPHNVRSFVERIGPTFLGRNWHEWISYRFPDAVPLVNNGLFIIGLVMSLFIFLGFILKFKQNPSIMEYYVFFYLAMMSIIWFYVEAYRYVMPITSFLLFYFFTGVSFIIQRISKKSKRVISYILISFFLINVFQAGLEIYRYQFASQNEKTMFTSNLLTAAWLKENITPDELIIADDPRWYVLETGLPVTPSPIFRDMEKVYRHITQFQGSIIVVDQARYFQRVCIVPVLQKYPDHFDLLKEFGQIQIYRLIV